MFAPRHGYSLLHMARLIDEFLIESLDERVLAEACEFGASPSDLDFLLSRTVPDWGHAVASTTKGGHLHVFRWMTERSDSRGPWEADFICAMLMAARCGNVEVLQWLHERGFGPIDDSVLLVAAHYGHLAVLKRLHEHASSNYAARAADAMRIVAKNGHVATVQWICENCKSGVDVAPAMAGAARNGDLELVQWLHQHKTGQARALPTL
jgi:hypothetical protein